MTKPDPDPLDPPTPVKHEHVPTGTVCLSCKGYAGEDDKDACHGNGTLCRRCGFYRLPKRPKFKVGDRVVIVWNGAVPHDELMVGDGKGGLTALKLPLKARVREARRQGSHPDRPTEGDGQWLYLVDLDKGPAGYDGWQDEGEIIFMNPVDTIGELA